jgi:DNA polymerase elongation subunit (family B)
MWYNGAIGEIGTIYSASTYDSLGNFKTFHISNYISEKALLEDFINELRKYAMSIVWNSIGEGFDLEILHNRCLANSIESVVSQHNRFYKLNFHTHIDLYMIMRNPLIQSNIFHNAYRDLKVDTVGKKLLGLGKVSGITGENVQNKTIAKQEAYNLRDSELVMKISQYKNNVALAVMQAITEVLGTLSFEEVCHSTLSIWWNQVFSKMGVPPKKIVKKDYAGGQMLTVRNFSEISTLPCDQ